MSELNKIVEIESDPVKDFLYAIFGDYPTDESFITYCFNPSGETNWRAKKYLNNLPTIEGGFYFAPTLIKKDEEGKIRRKQSNFVSMHAIVLDDVGTKCEKPELPPTAIIESSKGNYQYFYKLDKPILDEREANNIVQQLIKNGYLKPDSSGANTVRWVRLPAGINNKIDKDSGELNTFEVKLIECDESISYSVEELYESFKVDTTQKIVTPTLPNENELGIDHLLTYLESKEMVRGESGNGFISITCPWIEEHSDQEGLGTAIKPLFVRSGEIGEDKRAFKCHHDHCSERSIKELIHWAIEDGYEPLHPSNEGEYVLGRYCMIETGRLVGDMLTKSAEHRASLRYSDWSYTRGYEVFSGFKINKEGEKIPIYTQLDKIWVKHKNTVKVNSKRYDPFNPEKVIFKRNGFTYINTYCRPEHISPNSEPTAYLEHIDHILPNKEECDGFHDWVAYKLQHPYSRSYAFMMVAHADRLIDEGGTSFGIGRSVVADILKKVFKGSTVDLSFDVFSGKSNSSYNSWQAETQLVVVNEVQQEKPKYDERTKIYETIKDRVDTKPSYDVQINQKYGTIYRDDIFYNVLLFTNHADALMIPEGDRRIAVATNSIIKRERHEYEVLHSIPNDQQAVANVFHWYMSRDVSKFDHSMPPMWLGKQTMMEQTEHETDVIFSEVVDHLEGDLICLSSWMTAVMREANNHHLSLKENEFLKKDLKTQFKKFPPLNPEDKRHGGRLTRTDEGKATRVRVIRNKEHWQSIGSQMKSIEFRDQCLEELMKNPIDPDLD